MAGGFQYVKTSSFFAYTPAAAASAPGYEPTRLADWANTHPLVRTWRSVTTLANAISFNFGSVRNGSWVAILNANFTSVQIGIGDGSSFADIVSGGAYVTRTLTADLTDPEGYRKLFLATPYTGSVGRLEIPAQSTTDGLPYFKMGLVVWGSNLVTMSYNLQDPLQLEYVDPEYRVEGRDWSEATPAGIRFANISTRNTFPWAMASEWHALRLATRPGQRILVYFNQDNPQEVEVWERNRPASITRHGATQEIDTGFRTVA